MILYYVKVLNGEDNQWEHTSLYADRKKAVSEVDKFNSNRDFLIASGSPFESEFAVVASSVFNFEDLTETNTAGVYYYIGGRND